MPGVYLEVVFSVEYTCMHAWGVYCHYGVFISDDQTAKVFISSLSDWFQGVYTRSFDHYAVC
jgi:hypothetical protein